jgi:two-component system chemotaxis sensor kinase CheA
VEEVLGQQELVVSTLGSRLARVPHLAGAAVLDDGRVVGVLAAGELVRRAQPAGTAPRSANLVRPRVLVADDSLTTRSAMKALLEIAGYTVVAAADGEEAFGLLATTTVQVVVSDVQMPRLDGLGLTRRIKADPRLRSLPVVLVTSLDAPEDRAAGLEAGADGYLVKREVERGKLLDVVRQLLPGRT